MSKKRFWVESHSGGLFTIFDNGKIIPFCEDGKQLEDTLNNLNDENKELKSELKKYHDAFDCGSCQHRNYDWYDDGDEFEVCDKGNNEEQMDNHSCKDWEEL